MLRDVSPFDGWGEFPAHPLAFSPETPPAREVLAKGRMPTGTGAAGVAWNFNPWSARFIGSLPLGLR
jgi:hypothetical protein